MSDASDDTVSDYWAETFLYVYWAQATPSPREIAALHQIDPALQKQTSQEVAAILKDEDWWRMGPFLDENEISQLEAQLRSAGLTVEVKRPQ